MRRLHVIFLRTIAKITLYPALPVPELPHEVLVESPPKRSRILRGRLEPKAYVRAAQQYRP